MIDFLTAAMLLVPGVASIQSASSPAQGQCGRLPVGAAGPAELREIGRRVREEMIAEHGVVQSPELSASLEAILDKLEPAADEPGLTLSPTILDTDEVNARVLPGGLVLVNRGLIDWLTKVAQQRAPNDAARRARLRTGYLASVLSHELAHLTLGHTGALRDVRDRALRAGQPDPEPAFMNREDLQALRYSRECEFAADRAGALYALRAGWEIQDAMDLFRALDAVERAQPAAGDLETLTYLRTHPRNSEREAELEVFRGELKRHQRRFDDAVLMIRHNGALDHAIAVLEPVVADFPDLLPARHALATARHQQWLNTVPVQELRVRSDLVTIGVYFLPGIRGAGGDATLASAARAAYQDVLARRVLPEPLSHLALLEAYAGQTESALRRARRAVDLAPQNAGVLNNLGVVLYLAGNRAEARDVFARVVQAEPEHAPALFNLGRTLIDLGDRSGVFMLERYFALDPSSEWTRYAVSLGGGRGGGAAGAPGGGGGRGGRGDGTAQPPAGDAPAVAELRLGDPLAKVIATLGEPEERQDNVWSYPQRGVLVAGSGATGVALLALVAREAGDIEGIRVGDSVRAAVARWGPPAEVNGPMLFWGRRGWFISVQQRGGVVIALAVATASAGGPG